MELIQILAPALLSATLAWRSAASWTIAVTKIYPVRCVANVLIFQRGLDGAP